MLAWARLVEGLRRKIAEFTNIHLAWRGLSVARPPADASCKQNPAQSTAFALTGYDRVCLAVKPPDYTAAPMRPKIGKVKDYTQWRIKTAFCHSSSGNTSVIISCDHYWRHYGWNMYGAGSNFQAN